MARQPCPPSTLPHPIRWCLSPASPSRVYIAKHPMLFLSFSWPSPFWLHCSLALIFLVPSSLWGVVKAKVPSTLRCELASQSALPLVSYCRMEPVLLRMTAECPGR